jgi:hypothetical protein
MLNRSGKTVWSLMAALFLVLAPAGVPDIAVAQSGIT